MFKACKYEARMLCEWGHREGSNNNNNSNSNSNSNSNNNNTNWNRRGVVVLRRRARGTNNTPPLLYRRGMGYSVFRRQTLSLATYMVNTIDAPDSMSSRLSVQCVPNEPHLY